MTKGDSFFPSAASLIWFGQLSMWL